MFCVWFIDVKEVYTEIVQHDPTTPPPPTPPPRRGNSEGSRIYPRPLPPSIVERRRNVPFLRRESCALGVWLRMDGVAASKNWKTKVLRAPMDWNEYIPKKNRHSEGVPRYPRSRCFSSPEAKPRGYKGFPRQHSHRGGGISPRAGCAHEIQCEWWGPLQMSTPCSVGCIPGAFGVGDPLCPNTQNSVACGQCSVPGPWTATDLATPAMLFVYF